MLMSRKHQGRYRIIGHRDLHTRKDLRFLRVVLLLRQEALLENRLQIGTRKVIETGTSCFL